MEKNILKKVILENQEFINTIHPVKREYKIEKNANHVIIGARRAGKTWYMFSIIHEFIKGGTGLNQILYINFEDERLMELTVTDLDLLIESFKELYNTKPICFFDEIQNIPGWEKFVRRLADTGYKLFITGSNAEMISSEIATVLGGRFLIKTIYPLSFSEFLNFKGIIPGKHFMLSEQRINIRKLFDEYFYSGGFPEVLGLENKKEFLSNLFQKVFYGDIIARYGIKNDIALKLMIKKMAESVHNETSFSRIKNIIQSVGVKIGTATLIEYFHYLEESFLIFGLRNFSAKITSRESKKKHYFIDNGILGLFLFSPETILLENIVFIELLRRYKDNFYYYKNNNEVDFYLSEHKVLIQVCYSLNDGETKNREITALLKTAKKLAAEELLILTLDREEIIDSRIQVVPVWQWLLKKQPLWIPRG